MAAAAAGAGGSGGSRGEGKRQCVTVGLMHRQTVFVELCCVAGPSSAAEGMQPVESLTIPPLFILGILGVGFSAKYSFQPF